MVILAFLDDVIILFPIVQAVRVLKAVQNTFRDVYGLALTLSKCLFYAPGGEPRPEGVP